MGIGFRTILLLHRCRLMLSRLCVVASMKLSRYSPATGEISMSGKAGPITRGGGEVQYWDKQGDMMSVQIT